MSTHEQKTIAASEIVRGGEYASFGYVAHVDDCARSCKAVLRRQHAMSNLELTSAKAVPRCSSRRSNRPTLPKKGVLGSTI